MLNKVTLIGRLGKDPEARTFDTGNKKATLIVATSETHKNKSGEKKEVTEWHNVTCWNALADVVMKYMGKGTLVYVEGKLTTRSYMADDQKKYVTEIVADRVQILAGGRTQQQQQQQAGGTFDDISWS